MRLAEALKRRGFTTWMDTGLVAGLNFNDSIRKELADAEKVIVIWSPESIKSDYVKMEAGIAWAWNKLLPVRLSSMAVTEIPEPFAPLQTIDIANLDGLAETLKSVGIEASARRQLSSDEFIAALAKEVKSIDLSAFLQKVRNAGFRVVIKQSMFFKSTIPGFQEVSFATVLANGTVNTNYISDWAEKAGDAAVATSYLNGVAALIEHGTVRRENAPWTWRVEVWGVLPKLSSLLEHGDAWIELMKKAREQFALAAADRKLGN